MKVKKKTIDESKGDKVFDVLMKIFLWASLIIVLYPLIYVVSASFSNPSDVFAGKVWLFPVNPTLVGYKAVFKNNQIITGFLNSIFYLFVGTGISLVLTVLAAYPLSRKEVVGRDFLSGIFVFSMMFSGGLIPTYIVVKELGLINTRWAIILPSALSVWNVIMTKTYFKTTIPDELYEAAQIDGCSDIGYLFKIILPLSTPILAVMFLYYGVAYWNSYYSALIYLTDEKLFPLQVILRNILVMNNIDPTMINDVEVIKRRQGLVDVIKYSVIVVASLPVICIYPFVQKYFVKGVMIGAVKG